MEIGTLEEVIKTFLRNHPGQQALAMLAGDRQLGLTVPAEFINAAKTLASRPLQRAGEGSMMNYSSKKPWC